MKANRMSGTRMDNRSSRWAKLLRFVSGDWWYLEQKDGRYGVWHPWRSHRWENYRFTRDEAVKEQARMNSGMEYEICPDCGTTYAAHHNGRMGGIECPALSEQGNVPDQRTASTKS